MCEPSLTRIFPDSRTGYGGEKRTYSSTTGTYGSGGTGGEFASALAALVSNLTDITTQDTPFERNYLFLTNHLSLSI